MNRAQKEIAKYDIKSLRDGIEKCKKNILVFEEAIKKENDTIRWYTQIIENLENDLNAN